MAHTAPPSVDQRLERLWGDIEDTLHTRQNRRTRTKRSLTVFAGLTCTAVAVFALAPAFQPAVPDPRLHHAQGPVLAPAEVLRAGDEVSLSDGSELTTASESQITVVENSPSRFRTHLRRGRVAFNVKPTEGPHHRRWSIRAGTVKVEVIGTRFVVERSQQRVRVSVQRGKVKVSGPTVVGGVQYLTAGQSLETRLHGVAPDPAAATPAPPSEAPRPMEAAGGEDRSSDAPEDALPGEEEDVVLEAGATVHALLRRSDALRRHGRPRQAAVLLASALAEQPRSQDRALLAFTLGRIQLDTLDQARRAGHSFARAQRDGLPATLREQALAREVQAWAVAGRHEHAKARARHYLDSYRNGPNRELVLRWLERASDP